MFALFRVRKFASSVLEGCVQMCTNYLVNLQWWLALCGAYQDTPPFLGLLCGGIEFGGIDAIENNKAKRWRCFLRSRLLLLLSTLRDASFNGIKSLKHFE